MATRNSEPAALEDRGNPGPTTEAAIVDNSKRSVSIRINTSDCGRVKTIAQRLRVRDSDVFRYLIQRGLKELAPLFQGDARGHEMVAMLSHGGADLIDHFDLDPDQIARVVSDTARGDEQPIDADDIELLSMLSLPPRYLALRLSELTDSTVSPNDVRDALRHYIAAKYAPHDE